MRVILASASQRRRELLDLIGIEHEIIVSGVDETMPEGLSPAEQSKRLGLLKAESVFEKTDGDRVVIGSDTIVHMDGRLFGKPAGRDEAFMMIKSLEGRTHQVFTSVAVLAQTGDKFEKTLECDVTDVTFAPMSDDEIDEWVSLGECYDKAGAYAIQSVFARHIEKINGNYTTVIGLPVNIVYEILKKYI